MHPPFISSYIMGGIVQLFRILYIISSNLVLEGKILSYLILLGQQSTCKQGEILMEVKEVIQIL